MSLRAPLDLERVYTACCFILMAVTTAYAFLVFLFLPRPWGIDDMGLFNPVYMQIHYGRMTYPAYGPGSSFHAMFVHPPVHYLEIATLMHLGLTLPYAEGLTSLLLTLAVPIVIVFGRFSAASKLALLLGFLCALLWMAQAQAEIYGLRPDLEVALFWFLGLLLLQEGCLRRWNLVLTFLGSLAMTIASGIHYFAAPAFLGIAYFIVKARNELAREGFLRVLTAAAAGCCSFGVPYLSLFVAPHFAEIAGIIHSVQSAGAWYSPMLRHFAQYASWLSFGKGLHDGARALFWLLYVPLVLRLPLFAVGSAILASQRDTRGLACASLPLTFFIFGFSKGKWDTYYLPEILIYFCGLSMIAVVIFSALATKRWSQRLAQVLPLAILAGSVWFAYGLVLRALPLRPLLSNLDIARACAKKIVGDHALIGGRVGLWYVSGAQRWYNLEPDLTWARDTSWVGRDYFSEFDAVVEHNHMSDLTNNAQRKGVASWYLSGPLSLRGFFLDASQTHSAAPLDFLIFSTERARTGGYVYDGRTVLKFTARKSGDWTFLASVCPLVLTGNLNLPYFDVLPLPAPNNPNASGQSAIVAALMPTVQYARGGLRLAPSCARRDAIAGTLSPIDLKTLLSRFQATDRPIVFLRNIDDAVVPNLPTRRLNVRGVAVANLRLAYVRAQLTGQTAKLVTTAREPWSYAAQLEIPALPHSGRAWLAVHVHVLKGEIAVGILDQPTNIFLTRQYLDRNDADALAYLPLRNESQPETLIVENSDEGIVSQAVILGVWIVSERQPARQPAQTRARTDEPKVRRRHPRAA